jgi:hypothetical protein
VPCAEPQRPRRLGIMLSGHRLSIACHPVQEPGKEPGKRAHLPLAACDFVTRWTLDGSAYRAMSKRCPNATCYNSLYGFKGAP